MNVVIWTDPALENIQAIKDDLNQFNPYAAAKVANALIVSGNSLVHFPNRGRIVPGTYLREITTAYPYIIRYRVDGANIVILRVRHTSRRPTNP